MKDIRPHKLRIIQEGMWWCTECKFYFYKDEVKNMTNATIDYSKRGLEEL